MKHMIIIICAVIMSACMLSVPSVAAFNSIDIMDNETNSMQERAFNSSLAETKVDYKGVSVTGTNDEVMHKRLSEGTLTEILFVPIGRSEKQIGYSEGCECEDNGPEDFIVDGNTCLILNSVCLNVLVYENGNFVRSIDISQMGYPMFMTKYHDSLFIVDSVNDVICEYSYSCGDLISKHAFPSGATSNFMLCLTSDANSVFVMDDDYGLHDILNPEEQIKTPLSIEATGNKINWSTPYSQNQNSFSDVYVRFLNYDKEGNTYFAVYEPVWNSDIVLGETTIRKYTVEGDLIGVARIPVEDNLFTPEHSIIVTDEGRIYTFGLTDNGATISEVTLGSEYVSKINEWSARFSKLEREQGTSYKSQAVNNNREVAQNILISLTSFSWTINADNKYVRTSTALPSWISNAPTPSTLHGMPYAWGRWNTQSDFLSKVSQYASDNHLYQTGNILEHTSSCTIGQDCSGMASVAYGLTTKYCADDFKTNYYSVTESNMKCMDYFASSSHVEVFASVNATNTKYNIYDATKTTTGKVAYRSINTSDVYGYSRRTPWNDQCTAPTTYSYTVLKHYKRCIYCGYLMEIDFHDYISTYDYTYCRICGYSPD